MMHAPIRIPFLSEGNSAPSAGRRHMKAGVGSSAYAF